MKDLFELVHFCTPSSQTVTMIGSISMYSGLIAESSRFFSFHLMLLARIDLDPDYNMGQSKGRAPSAEEPHSSTSRRASSRKMTATGTPQKV